MKLPNVISLETLGVIVAVALFIVSGQGVGSRAVGILQLVFSVQILHRREVPAGWKGLVASKQRVEVMKKPAYPGAADRYLKYLGQRFGVWDEVDSQ